MPYSRRTRHTLAVLLIFTQGCCDSCYTADRPEPTPPPSGVTALKIAPHTVYAISGAVFVIRARILDADGGSLPSHPQLTWTPGTDLTVTSHAGDSVVLQAATLTSATPVVTTLAAQLGSINAVATITILAEKALGTIDSAVGDYRTGMVPDVVLLDSPAPSLADDSLVAFVGIGLLGNLSGGTGEAARFASDQSFDLETVNWRVTKDVIDVRSSALPQPGEGSAPIAPTFRVWIATSVAGAPAMATDDVRYATRVFTREYTGLALHAEHKSATGLGPFTLELGPDLKCLGTAEKLLDLGVPTTTTAFSKESLNVVYVDDILLPPAAPDLVGTPAMMTGYSCPLDNTVGTVILISALRRSGGTLTHELGHELGLREPYSGHTLLAPGFAYTNMMWPWETDAATAPRSTLSLGQAFRINMDDHSWLQFLTGKTRDCDPTEVDRSCPPLAKDFP